IVRLEEVELTRDLRPPVQSGHISRYDLQVPAHLSLCRTPHPAPGRATHLGGNLRSAQRPLIASSATVRRALATRQPIRASRRIPTDRALWDHNWDSNTVLYETWQIPGTNTSRAA